MKNALSYDDFIVLAKKNYAKGGDVVVECWDKKAFEYYTKEFGTITKTKAMNMFRMYKSQEGEWY